MPSIKYSIFFIYLLALSCQSTQPSTEIEQETTVKSTKNEDRKKVIKKLPPKAFKAQLASTNTPLLLDVRTPQELSAGQLNHALNINFRDSDFIGQVQDIISPKRPVFVYCQSGGRSAKAAKILEELGCQEIYDLAGGYMAWVKVNTAVLPDSLVMTTQ
ncbi:MAG: rhodanese-like domain-containing protein [Bacteroidota bacterium]